MEEMLNFIPAPIALVLMFIGFAALAVGAIRLGYKQYVKQWALELVTLAENSIMGSGQGAKKKGAGLCCAARRIAGLAQAFYHR